VRPQALDEWYDGKTIIDFAHHFEVVLCLEETFDRFAHDLLASTIRMAPVAELRLSSLGLFTMSVTSTEQPPKGAARTSRECSVRAR
jgi:hypothetical protein